MKAQSSHPQHEYERRGGLARALQEALTAVARLRANRQQVSQVEAFRDNIKRLLSSAHDEARSAGYSRDDVQSAVYAVTVSVDESVLNSSNQAFAEWGRRPLQEEIFGGSTGGEIFFEQLRALLKRSDSADLADVLEVYHLSLLLGFEGRYSTGGHSDLQRWRTLLADRIASVRGVTAGLAPDWAPPVREAILPPRDVWTRRLAVILAGMFGIALVLFVAFAMALQSRIQGLQQVLTGLVP